MGRRGGERASQRMTDLDELKSELGSHVDTFRVELTSFLDSSLVVESVGFEEVLCSPSISERKDRSA